jgi:hypothetical protein
MSDNPIYKIKDWSANYEKAQSRKCKRTYWIAIPNQWDGKRYRRIMAHPKQAEIYAAWILMVQIASRCEPRGSLVDDGIGLDAEDMADSTGLNRESFELAIEVLCQPRIGWLEKT